jgi:RNA polymerase sigma-70 factor (ECF subfamily)
MAGNEYTSTEPGTVSVQELNDAIVQAQPGLLRRALYLTRDRDQAIDLVQRTVERACRSRCQLRPGSNPDHWLRAILTSRFIDEVRHQRATHWTSAMDCDRCAAPEPADAPLWTLLDADDVVAATRRLPRLFREPFELFAFGHLSQRMIGARLGLPIGTIGTRIFRAKRLLRDLLMQRAALLRVAPPAFTSCDAPVAHRTRGVRSCRNKSRAAPEAGCQDAAPVVLGPIPAS